MVPHKTVYTNRLRLSWGTAWRLRNSIYTVALYCHLLVQECNCIRCLYMHVCVWNTEGVWCVFWEDLCLHDDSRGYSARRCVITVMCP